MSISYCFVWISSSLASRLSIKEIGCCNDGAYHVCYHHLNCSAKLYEIDSSGRNRFRLEDLVSDPLSVVTVISIFATQWRRANFLENHVDCRKFFGVYKGSCVKGLVDFCTIVTISWSTMRPVLTSTSWAYSGVASRTFTTCILKAISFDKLFADCFSIHGIGFGHGR